MAMYELVVYMECMLLIKCDWFVCMTKPDNDYIMRECLNELCEVWLMCVSMRITYAFVCNGSIICCVMIPVKCECSKMHLCRIDVCSLL